MTSVTQWIKPLYQMVPFKAPLFHAVRSVWTPPESVYRHLHFKGVIRIPVGSRSFLMQHHGHQIENELFWSGVRGGWEPQSLRIWQELARSATTVLDIGANTGLFSLVAKAASPDATVIAFEPVKRVWERLVANEALNEFNFVAENLAVSNASGTVTLYDDGQDLPLSASLQKDFPSLSSEASKTEVASVTVDDYLEKHPLGTEALTPDLVKIDVEGHEAEVVQGMTTLLSRARPSLLVEVLTREVAEALHDLLAPLDYRFYDIDESGPVRATDRVQVSSSFNVLACKGSVADRIRLA